MGVYIWAKSQALWRVEAGDLTGEGRKMADISQGEELEELGQLINRRMDQEARITWFEDFQSFFFQMITFVHGKMYTARS